MSAPALWVRINIPEQRLCLCDGERVLWRAPVSTAANGPGERMDSLCTPTGWHAIRARIGDGAPMNSVFVGRRPSGEIYAPALGRKFPERDWILTRLLWLSGLEPGRNRLGRVDSMRRFIYIHGAPDDVPMGQPRSHGCVRMRNAAVVELFDRVPAGTRVLIEA